jgi:hypothetical protein
MRVVKEKEGEKENQYFKCTDFKKIKEYMNISKK